MTYTVTSTSTTITFNDPVIVTAGVMKRLPTVVFHDGTDQQLDKGKNSNYITIQGTETTDSFNKMQTLNNVMDNQETITISGFTDNSLNTEYYIRNLEYHHIPGTTNVYRWSITLERLHDNIT